jgi:tetratricopeptide (TPR) repeat protein
LYRGLDDQIGTATTLNDLGIVADGLGNYAEAKRLYVECLAMRRQIGHRGGIANTLNNLGYFAYLHGEYAEALPLLEESLAIFKEIGAQYHLALCLGNLGATVSALGGHQEARRYFYEAIRFALEIWSVPLVLDALVGTAALLAASQPDEKERVAEVYAFALQHPASDQFAKDRAEQGLADLATELPPDVMAAAQERGETAIFEVIVAEVLADMAFLWEE